MIFNRISRRSHVAPFMNVLSEAAALERQGRRIIHMEAGEPAAAPPRAVREAAVAALGAGRVGYTEALGLPRAMLTRDALLEICAACERLGIQFISNEILSRPDLRPLG